jgi:hypothetical protein
MSETDVYPPQPLRLLVRLGSSLYTIYAHQPAYNTLGKSSLSVVKQLRILQGVVAENTHSSMSNPYEASRCQETNAPSERMFCFFPLYWSWRHRSLATCSGLISISRLRHGGSAPHTYGGSVTMAMVSAEKRWYGPLRPRNIFVTACCPMQSWDSTPRVRQLVPGLGEGPHTCTGSDARRSSRAGADVQSKAKGSRPKSLGAPTRSLTQ